MARNCSVRRLERFCVLQITSSGLEPGLGNSARRFEIWAMGISTATFFIGAAIGLTASAWALKNLNRWGRGPVLFTQLVSLGLAWNLWGGETKPYSIILALLAVLVIVEADLEVIVVVLRIVIVSRVVVLGPEMDDLDG